MLAGTAFAQQIDPVRCVITVYRLDQGEDGRLIKSLEFVPKIAEEELTNKTLRLPESKLFVIASVFPTDESMASARGQDSLRLGLAVTSRKWPDAFSVPHSAVAETTFSETFDTARVETNTSAEHRRWVVRLECWDPRREKQK
jgi:hypothetical protein